MENKETYWDEDTITDFVKRGVKNWKHVYYNIAYADDYEHNSDLYGSGYYEYFYYICDDRLEDPLRSLILRLHSREVYDRISVADLSEIKDKVLREGLLYTGDEVLVDPHLIPLNREILIDLALDSELCEIFLSLRTTLEGLYAKRIKNLEELTAAVLEVLATKATYLAGISLKLSEIAGTLLCSHLKEFENQSL